MLPQLNFVSKIIFKQSHWHLWSRKHFSQLSYQHMNMNDTPDIHSQALILNVVS